MVEKRWLKFGDGRWEIGGEAKSGGVAEMRCRDRVMRSWRSTDVGFRSGRVKRSRRIWDVGFRSGRVIRSRRNKGWKKAWEVRWWEEEGLKSWRKCERKRWEKNFIFLTLSSFPLQTLGMLFRRISISQVCRNWFQ